MGCCPISALMANLAPLVLLAPRITDDSVAVWRASLRRGWQPERLSGWRVPEGWVSDARQVVVYGEPLFAEAVCDQIGRVLLEPSADWLTQVPEAYLQRRVKLMTLAEARCQEDVAFVKPADGKIFEPRVYGTGRELPGEEHVDGSIPVLRSGVVDFRLEVRCFVHHRALVSCSPYWREDALAQDDAGHWSFAEGEEQGARDFAARVLADERVELPPACTLDVGRFADGSWAIVEANPCWGAGLYGCDPDAVLGILGDAVISRAAVREEDRKWISARRAV